MLVEVTDEEVDAHTELEEMVDTDTLNEVTEVMEVSDELEENEVTHICDQDETDEVDRTEAGDSMLEEVDIEVIHLCALEEMVDADEVLEEQVETYVVLLELNDETDE